MKLKPLLLLLTAFVLGGATTAAAQDRFVATTGSDSGNDCSNAATPCATVQKALDEAAAGDVIEIAAGTYAQSSTLNNFQDGLTLQGAGGTPVLDFTGVSGYGIDARNVSNLTFSNLTAQNGGHYGFKIYNVNGLALTDVTAQGFARSEIDLNNVQNATLTNVLADGQNTAGVGVALSGVDNVSFVGVSTSGNDWGGVGLYTTSVNPINGVSNVTIDAASSFAEAAPVYVDAEYPGTVGDLALAGFDYALFNPDYQGRGDDYVFYYRDLPAALGFATAIPSPEKSYIQRVVPDGGGFSVLDNAFVVGTSGGTALSIQTAVDAAAPGAQIDVLAGTYEEQVVVAKDDLTIEGVGSGSDDGSNTIVVSPTDLAYSFTTGSNDNFPVVGIDGATGVTLRNLRVDGAGRGNTNRRFIGVGFWNAGGAVLDAVVTGIRETPFSGNQHGVAIYAANDAAAGYTIEVGNSTVVDFQKTGIALSGNSLTVDVHDNVVTGFGPTSITAQNGIQVSYGPTGAIRGNTLSGIDYTGSGWVATTILPYFPTGTVVVADNEVLDGQLGLYVQNASADVTGNTFVTDEYGAILDPNGEDVLPTPSPFGADDAGSQAETSARVMSAGAMPLAFTFSGNTVVGSDVAGSIGLYVYSNNETLTAVAEENLVRDYDYGILVQEATAGDIASASFNQNCVVSNGTVGLYNNAALAVDAENNWWGNPAGPSINQLVSDPGAIDAEPFAAAPIATVAGCDALTTVEVTSADMKGWWFYEEIPTGSGQFTTGPAPAPLGSGSAELTVDATGRLLFGTQAYAGTRFDAIDQLFYSSFQQLPGDNILAPSLQLDVDYDLTDGTTSWQGRLVFEPYFTTPVVPGAWQTWSPSLSVENGAWWSTGTPIVGDAAGTQACPQSDPCTWSEVLALYPDAGIRPMVNPTAGNLQFKAGGPWADGFTGNVDAFTISVDGQTTTYDFEAGVDECAVADGPDVPGGFSIDAANSRYLIDVNASQGVTYVRMYNHTNMTFGPDLVDPNTGAALAGYTRSTSGDDVIYTWTGSGDAPTAVQVAFVREDTGIDRVSFWIEVTDGCGRTVDMDPVLSLDAEDDGELPGDYELGQNYPNPFNPTTAIRFELPEAANVRVAVYDMLGRQVALLASGQMAAGEHQVTWNALDDAGQRVASGMYLYRLETQAFTQSRTMVLLK